MSRPTGSRLPAALLLASLASCGPKAAEAPAPAAPASPTAAAEVASAATHPPPADSPVTKTQLHMSEHFAMTRQARLSLVNGDVEGARAKLRWVGEHPPEAGVPTEWGGWFEEMQAAARDAANAVDPVDVAAGVARVGNSCGGCHASLSVDLQLPEPAPPPQTPGVTGHMATHAWATELMWLSLVEPDGALWTQAAAALGSEPLADEDFSEGMGSTDGVQEWADQVHQAAAGAAADDNPDTRADLYGQVVGACVGCHLEIRGTP